MVLESITNPANAEKHPFRTAALGFVYVTFAYFLSIWIFEEHSSLVMVFLTVGAAIPLFYNSIAFEESKDLSEHGEKILLKEHSKVLWFFMSFFMGMVLAFAFWYVVMPAETTTNVFRVQADTISSLNQQITGNVVSANIFSKIFLNNLQVLIFAVLFAFLYGSGAIFILTWNASVIGAAMGNFINLHLAQYSASTGMSLVAGYFFVTMMSLVRYFIHGIPEILAYFVAGLAGGILSTAIMNKDYKNNNFEKILVDVSDLILISVLILFVSGVVEVYVTPLFF